MGLPATLVSLTVVTHPAARRVRAASAVKIFVFIMATDNHNRRARQA
jgi:hypothetical protein